MSGADDDIPLHLAWFSTAFPEGPAIGEPETTIWANFCDILWHRREGPKAGPGFCAARYKLEDDRRHVRRLRANVLARTAIAMDIEPNKGGESPPSPDELAKRIASHGWAAAIWSSHNHRPPDNVRCRVVLLPSHEIDHDLPAAEVIADDLGLTNVLDRSKLGASSFFYLPSCIDDAAEHHQELIVPGAAIDATWLVERARAWQEHLKAEGNRAAAEAHAKAAARRAETFGSDPDDSLIEQIRPSLGSLDDILRAHGYDRRGFGNVAKYRHANSQSGSSGADIKTFGGIERVYSHNGSDVLHAANLPSWCTVSAVDAFDATVVLDFGGDRKRALRELAERFGLSKREQNRAVARLIYRLCREQAPQEVIETAAYAEGERLGLTRDDVIRVATWIAAKAQHRRAA